jgi:hypothetical protein
MEKSYGLFSVVVKLFELLVLGLFLVFYLYFQLFLYLVNGKSDKSEIAL